MKKLWQLFLTFFKLGAFTFGGGYAMISLIENEIVSKKGWITREEMMDIVTIAESTPGPLAVNMATFVGTKVKGFVGALVATLGLIIPPFVIIAVITLLLNQFRDVTLVGYALNGIQAGVVVLILNAFLKFFKSMDKSIISFIFLIVAFLVALLTDFSVVLLILIGGVAGVSITMISSYIAKKKTSSVTANTKNSDTSNMVIDDNNANVETNTGSNNDANGVENNSSNGDSNEVDNGDNSEPIDIGNGDVSSANIDSDELRDETISDDTGAIEVDSSDESISRDIDTSDASSDSDNRVNDDSTDASAKRGDE